MYVCIYIDLAVIHGAGKAHEGPMEIWEFIAWNEISKGQLGRTLESDPRAKLTLPPLPPKTDLVKSPQFKLHMCFLAKMLQSDSKPGVQQQAEPMEKR